MTVQVLSILMFATTFVFLLFGFPVAFTLAGVSILFALIASNLGFLSPDFLALIPSKIFGTMTNELLVAVPLFIFMGLILEKSREAGGLPFLFIYKTTIIFFCFLIFTQTIALIFRCILVIRNKEKKNIL